VFTPLQHEKENRSVLIINDYLFRESLQNTSYIRVVRHLNSFLFNMKTVTIYFLFLVQIIFQEKLYGQGDMHTDPVPKVYNY
jgi:hypothetical protein